MKIYSLPLINQTQPKPSFKNIEEEWCVFGYDEGGKAKRDYIRDWQTQNYIPYQSIYEKEGQKSEHEIKTMLSEFNKKSTPINDNILTKIGLNNFEHLGYSNSSRGAMIKGYEIDKLIQVKKAGIKRIASLMKSQELESACKEQNLEYLYFNMDVKAPCFEDKLSVENKSKFFWQNIANIKEGSLLENYVKGDIDSWQQKARKSIDELINFVKFMQKDNVYLGCACGTYRTDFAVILNFLFNPKANYDCNITSYSEHLKSLENLYRNLTISDKSKMGWTKNFEKQFAGRLNKLKIHW